LGLIFIAVSISPEKTVGKNASVERTLQANSAFNVVFNAFLFLWLHYHPPGCRVGRLNPEYFCPSKHRPFGFLIFREVHG
jgi:hypothetical protein